MTYTHSPPPPGCRRRCTSQMMLLMYLVLCLLITKPSEGFTGSSSFRKTLGVNSRIVVTNAGSKSYGYQNSKHRPNNIQSSLPSQKDDKTEKSPSYSTEEIAAQAEAAIREAEEALKQVETSSTPPSSSSSSTDDTPETKRPKSPRPPSTPKEKSIISAKKVRPIDVTAATIGGIALGLLSGGIIDIALTLNPSSDFDDYVAPPAGLALFLAFSAYQFSQQEDSLVGKATRVVLGRPIKSLGSSVTQSIQNSVDRTVYRITSFPGRVARSIQTKIDDTTRSIAAVPGRISTATKKAVDDTVDEIKATPKKVADGTKKAVENTVVNTKTAVQKTVQDTQTAVQKTVQDTQTAVTTSVDSTKKAVVKTVDDAVRFPGKKLEEITDKIAGDKPTPKQPPKPPETPPQPQSFQTSSETTTTTTTSKTPTPEVKKTPPPLKTKPKPKPKKTTPTTKPTSEVKLPEVKFPELQMPKFSAPSQTKAVPLKPKSSTRKIDDEDEVVEVVSETKDDKKDEGPIFTEVSLKSLLKQDAEKSAAVAQDDTTSREADVVEQRQFQAKETRQEQEAKKAAAAEAKRQEQEAKKVAAAEARRQEQEAKQAAAAEAKRQEQEAKQAAAERRREEQEAKKIAAAEKRRREIEQRKAATEARRQQLEDKKAAAAEAAEKRRMEAEAKKKAAEERRRELEAQKAAAAEAAAQKRREAEAQKAEAAERRKQEIAAQKAAAEAKRREVERKREEAESKKAAERVMKEAKPGATISLFGFGGGQPKREATATTSVTPSSFAPRGVPTISKWKQNQDGSISGFISGSALFGQGEAITTSSIVDEAIGGTVVKTTSGSRYFLEPIPKQSITPSRSFSFFGGGETKQETKPTTTTPTPQKQDAASIRAMKIKEAKEKAAREMEAKLEARRQAEEDKRRRAEELKALKEEEKQRRAEEQRAKLERQKKAAAAEKVLKQAKPRATISLFGFGGGGGAPAEATKPVRPLPKVTKAPRGVPVIIDWKQQRDGSISGRIIGSPNFTDGDKVETSPIVSGKIENNSLVRTGSGSRYFLSSDDDDTKQKEAPKRSLAAEKAMKTSKPSATISLFGFGGKTEKTSDKATLSSKSSSDTIKKQQAEKAAKAEAERKKKAEEMRAKLEQQKKAAAAEKAMKQAKPRATISLFGFGGGGSVSPTEALPKVTKAPRGVPVIIDWKQNRDGSISGRIIGSPNFTDGDKVETSPIVSGKIVNNSLVRTGSGSQYFLSSDDAKQKQTPKKSPLSPTAEKTLKTAKPGATISLFGFGGKNETTSDTSTKSSSSTRSSLDTFKKQQAEKAAKAEAERKKKAEEMKAKLEQQKKAAAAEKAMKQAKPRATISLFGFGGGSSSSPADAKPVRPLPKVTKAPRGVPVIIDWKQQRDGSISGRIIGSPNFTDGDKVETSPIVSGKIENNSLVRTGSGSQYFLSSDDDTKQKPSTRKPPSSSTAAAAAAEKVMKTAKPGATISLFGFGGGGKTKPAAATSSQSSSRAAPAKSPPSVANKGPPGVPSLNNWKANRDGSITGFISGSPSFNDGERITTSSIAAGDVKKGQVVRTGSGSRYFLV